MDIKKDRENSVPGRRKNNKNIKLRYEYMIFFRSPHSNNSNKSFSNF